jgi:hypothetical protein
MEGARGDDIVCPDLWDWESKTEKGDLNVNGYNHRIKKLNNELEALLGLNREVGIDLATLNANKSY